MFQPSMSRRKNNIVIKSGNDQRRYDTMTSLLCVDFGMRSKMLNQHKIGLRLAHEHVIRWIGLGCVTSVYNSCKKGKSLR